MDEPARVFLDMDTGEAAKALEVLKTVQREYVEETGFQAIAAAVEARARQDLGDETAASEALGRALEFAKNADPQAALAVSRACFALGEDAEGERIVTSSVRSNHEDEKLVAAARKLLKDAGREDVTSRLIDEQVSDMLAMTEQALALAKKAQIAQAQTIIAEAVAGLPRNVGVLVAAAQINLLYLSQEGLSTEVVNRVRGYLASLDTLAHGTERVVKMQAYFKELLRQASTGAVG